MDSAETRIRLRPAVRSDSQTLYTWRNEPSTYQHFRDARPVTPPEHERWFEQVLDSDQCLLLVGMAGTELVGTIRFDATGQRSWEVSITVAPHKRGRGLAAVLLECGLEALVARRPGAERVVAYVAPANSPSLRLFAGSGFVADPTGDASGDFVRLERRLV